MVAGLFILTGRFEGLLIRHEPERQHLSRTKEYFQLGRSVQSSSRE